MRSLIVSLMSLMLSVQADTAQQATVSGQVRLADGWPVAGAQVTLFDLADLHQGAVARAMTDESGFFALPLASLGGSALPQGFALGPNYPNPFNPSTMIPYQLPMATQVRLDVFNVLGQHIATLVDVEQPAGFHAAQWDATDAAGQAMAAGVYFYRLTVSGGQQTQRMVLVDGQAGIAAAASSASVAMPTEAAEREYGLVVSGEGLTTYTDAAFGVRVGMAAVELVVDAAPLTSGNVLAGDIWGDVNNDGQVGLEDAMLVVMSRSNPSIAMPNNGSILLGDVNGDGAVNETDVLVIMRYISNPLDGALPAGIGQRIASGKRNSDDSSEPPSWSPDGQYIAFSSNRDSRDSRDSDHEIYVMGSDGSDPRRLTDNSASDQSPSWSPDGQHIAFSSSHDGNYEIYVMGSDGSDPRRLTDNSASDQSPSWSPDGQYIAFSSSRDGNYEIYVMGSDGSDPRRLTDNSASDQSPSWSPDGQHIAFSSNRDGSNYNYEIYVMAADDSDGSSLRRLTNHRRIHESPSWSPDGQHIAFSSNRDGKYEIYVMAADDSDGSSLRRLTDNSASDLSPSWSPDGQHIAFSSNRDGKVGIHVMKVDGSETPEPVTPEPETPEPETPEPETPEPVTPEPVTPEPETPEPETPEPVTPEPVTPEPETPEPETPEPVTPEPVTPEPETPEPETPEPVTPTDPVAGGSTGEVAMFSLPGDASMEFVWIEPGVFQMGSNTGRKDESPVHEVEISRGFWLGKYEITQGQWKAVMNDEPWSGRKRVISDSSHPAVIISWDEVQEFIGRLNAAVGEELYRLPTEAEWEYACRAGTQTRWSFGDDESQLKNYAWYFNNSEGAKAVGSRLPNPWGLYDMHGNIWEWVQDWYDEEYYNSSLRNDPQGPTSGLGRVIRGGHFGHIDGVQSAYRHLHSPESRSYTIGVRLLRIPGD